MNKIRVEAIKEDDAENWIANDEEHLYDLIDENIEKLLSGEIDSFSVVTEED